MNAESIAKFFVFQYKVTTFLKNIKLLAKATKMSSYIIKAA